MVSRNQRREIERIRLSPRQRQILGLLYRYRVLDSKHIYALLGRKNEKNLNAQVDLRVLFDLGLVNRLPNKAFRRDELTDPQLYELSERGALAIDPVLRAVWFKKLSFGDHTPSEHNLHVCHFVASVEAAAIQRGLVFITKEQMGNPASLKTLHNKNVVPDAVFGLEYPDESQVGNFVEFNTGSMSGKRTDDKQNSYYKKFQDYADILGRKLYEEHYDTTNPFFLLFITTHDENQKNAKVLLRSIPRAPKLNVLFKAIPQYREYQRAPLPIPSALTEPWEREGYPAFNISTGKEVDDTRRTPAKDRGAVSAAL